MNNEKTLREKSMEWWDEVTESEAAVYRMQYFKTRESLTDEQVDFVYQSEHPATIKDKFQSFDGTNDHFAERETISQQTNSVVSIEDAADAYAKGIANSDKTERRLAKCDFSHGANWQKAQYKELLSSYGELKKVAEMYIDNVDNYPDFKMAKGSTITEYFRTAIKKANNILKQFNQQ